MDWTLPVVTKLFLQVRANTALLAGSPKELADTPDRERRPPGLPSADLYLLAPIGCSLVAADLDVEDAILELRGNGVGLCIGGQRDLSFECAVAALA